MKIQRIPECWVNPWNLIHHFFTLRTPHPYLSVKGKKQSGYARLIVTPSTAMCPGFEEWWLYKCFKFSKLVIFNFYTQIMHRRFLVDTMYVHMHQLVIETKHFHSCWYFSEFGGQWSVVSEFVVVAILYQWWLFFLSGGRYQPLPTSVGTSLPVPNLLPGCRVDANGLFY